ncbi:hypothetical protein C7K38_08550 [Tetragenococcus osmophilus]|uniref:Uncharacterized protein n=1 Tax=Tetragenococcus osmophilus TaxID=526944 RepID=A0AA38CUZ6_9ENTE|nr:hypothetical protein [Tetragenococcus osmophilus]AYW48409.1 hypothetical protein C7K38_08550 [Tetragenococcus osmophilus]GMA54256.1 hypothetical protein GCM10025857_56130 [Alicyclobacillus contaminans]GMA71873.1 hypothetical protein GCM10025885_09220 [Tetragenococcus osmophilus]
MKKTEKEKRKLFKEKQGNPFDDDISRQLKDKLESYPNMDRYVMFLAVMKVLIEYVDNGNWAEKAPSFVKKYYFPRNKIEEVRQISAFRYSYQDYCELTRDYYLLTEITGKKIFQKILNWFPSEKEKSTIVTWPTSFLVSLFRPIESENNIYFEDIRTKEKHKVMLLDDALINKVKTFRAPFLSLLVPSDKGYVTDIILECENFELINPIKTKNLSKKDWGEYIFRWYRTNLLRSFTSKNASF